MKKYAVILSSLAFLLTACASAPADSVSAAPVPTETPAPTAEPTPQRVQDIAAQVGYESQGRFAQAFYDQFRQTPLEYRRLSK